MDYITFLIFKYIHLQGSVSFVQRQHEERQVQVLHRDCRARQAIITGQDVALQGRYLRRV